MNLRLTVSTLALAGLIVAACGGGDGGGQSNDAAGLESAAREFGNSLFGGDTDRAYELLAADCRDQVSKDELQQTMAVAAVFIKGFYNVDLDEIKVDDIETRNVEDGAGEVMLTIKAAGIDSDELNADPTWDRWVYEDGGWKAAECEQFAAPGDSSGGGSTSGGDDEEPLTGPGSSRDEPAPIGTAVQIAGWELKVNSTNPDAASEIVSDDSFIEPPEAGKVFYLVNLTATYVGNGEDESASLFFGLDFSAVGASAVAYELYDDACTPYELPDALDQNAEVFEGGTVTGDICFAVDEDDADSLLLSAKESFGFSGGQRAWFDLR